MEGELSVMSRVRAFGENLTTEGVDVSGAVLGERWRVGTTLLEVVRAVPALLQAEPEDGRPRPSRGPSPKPRGLAPTWIIEEGDLGAGDAIEVDLVGRPDHGVSVRLVSDAMLVDHSLIHAPKRRRN